VVVVVRIFFYLAFAIFVFAIARIRRPSTSLVWLALYSSVVAGALFAAFYNLDAIMAFAKQHVRGFLSTDSPTSSFYRWFFYFSPYIRIWEFALGCLTAQLFLIVQSRPVTAVEQIFATVSLGAALVFLFVFGGVYAFNLGSQEVIGLSHFFALNFGCAIPIAILIFYVGRYKNTFSKVLALPLVVWLGEISFSIYAVHTWTLRPFIRPPMSFDAVYAADAVLRVAMGIGFTLIVSAATYKLIEQPSRKYLRAKFIAKN
jgi:peptidoglycan/LPS O-acetylase OafA/YrhL